MKNSKFITGFSIFGFLLSIVSSFGNHRTLGGRFLMALIFGVIFGICAFLISFLIKNYFESDNSSGLSDGTSGTAAAVAGDNSAAPSTHAVDITVQEEELPSDENESQFYVGSKRQMLNDEDLNQIKKSDAPAAAGSDSVAEQIRAENQSSSINSTNPAASSNNAGFVPVSLSENAQNFSSIEARTDKEVQNDKKAAKMNEFVKLENTGSSENASGSDGLDVLPDLEDIGGVAASVSSSGTGDDIIEGSGYAESSDFTSGSTKSAEEVTEGKDAELMAKAISTLLAKE